MFSNALKYFSEINSNDNNRENNSYNSLNCDEIYSSIIKSKLIKVLILEGQYKEALEAI